MDTLETIVPCEQADTPMPTRGPTPLGLRLLVALAISAEIWRSQLARLNCKNVKAHDVREAKTGRGDGLESPSALEGCA